MANITVLEILTKLADLLGSIPSPGLVLVHESFVTNDDEFYQLFVGHEETTEAHGILISYIGFTQKEDGPFAVIVRHKFAIEFLMPYKGEPIEGKNSHQRFEELQVTPARMLLNTKMDLDFDGRVRHELLQSETDWAVKRWGGGSTSKKLTHYAPTELAVTVREKTVQPCT